MSDPPSRMPKKVAAEPLAGESIFAARAPSRAPIRTGGSGVGGGVWSAVRGNGGGGSLPIPSRAREQAVLFRRVPAGVRRTALERFALALREEVADGREFECLITTDRELQRLNRQFRGKDEPTDVLSFPAAATPAGAATLGALAVSWQRATAQAGEYGHSVESELRILMLHGVLHLLGMDHETDRGRMARLEARWRRHFDLPDGLIERARR